MNESRLSIIKLNRNHFYLIVKLFSSVIVEYGYCPSFTDCAILPVININKFYFYPVGHHFRELSLHRR